MIILEMTKKGGPAAYSLRESINRSLATRMHCLKIKRKCTQLLTKAGALSLVNMLKVCAKRMTNDPRTTMCDMGAAVVKLM